MNDRYLFRGRRLDKGNEGEWIIGYIQMRPTHKNPVIDYVQVDPATVGQCTGLKDKNGVLIYESDIIKDDYGRNFRVVYNQQKTQFEAAPTYSFMYSLDLCEVIGNVHENVEILVGRSVTE